MDLVTYAVLNKKIDTIGNIPDEKITEAVNTYLDENPPTTGATAEQAAQIDKNVADIDELKGDLSYLENDEIRLPYVLEQGAFTNGLENNDTTLRLRTNILTVDIGTTLTIKNSSGFKYSIAFINNDSFIGETGWRTDDLTFSTFANKIRIIIARQDNSVIDVDNSIISILKKQALKSIDDVLKDSPVRFSSLSDMINTNIKDLVPLNLINGRLNKEGTISDGFRDLKQYRYSDDFYEYYGKVLHIKPAPGYKVSIIYYSDDGNPLNISSEWITEEKDVFIQYPKLKFSFSFVDTSCFSIINEELYDTKMYIRDEKSLTWSNSFLDNGVRKETNLRICSNEPVYFANQYDTLTINCPSNYFIACIALNKDTAKVEIDTGWVTDCVLKKDKYDWYIQIKKSDDSAIDIDVVNDFKIIFSNENNAEIQYKHIDFSYVRGFCHRARCTSNMPENSYIGAKECFLNGNKFLEIDVRLTKDNKLVLCHNSTINATSDGNGNVIDYTLEELQAFDFSYSNGVKLEKYSDVKITTLEKMLLTCKQYNMMLCLDMVEVNYYKSSTYIRDVYDLVKKYGMCKNVLWHFSTITGIRILLALDNSATVAYSINTLSDNNYELISLMSARNQVGITTQFTNYVDSNSNYEKNVQILQTIINEGIIAFAYTVNQFDVNKHTDIIDHLIELGFVGIGSDDLPIEPNAILITSLIN